MQTTEKPRKARGYGSLLNGSGMTELDQAIYPVPSQSRNSMQYIVHFEGEEWNCGCPDHQFRLVYYKHIYTVQLWANLRETAKPQFVRTEFPEAFECKFRGSCCVLMRARLGTRVTQVIYSQRILHR
jgi:hypothetical protein